MVTLLLILVVVNLCGSQVGKHVFFFNGFLFLLFGLYAAVVVLIVRSFGG
jgi:hypothetical protein